MNRKRKPNKTLFGVLITVVITTIVIFTATLAYEFIFLDRIYPNVYFSSVSLSGMARQEAREIIEKNLNLPKKLLLTSDNESIEIDLVDLDFSYDTNSILNSAFNVKRSNNLIRGFYDKFIVFGRKHVIKPVFNIDERGLDEFIEIVAQKLKIDATSPSVEIVDNNIEINKGGLGKKLKKEELKAKIISSLETLDRGEITIPVEIYGTVITDAEAETLKQRAKKLVGKKILVRYSDQLIDVDDKSLVGFVNFGGGFQLDKIIEYTEKNVSTKIDQVSQNAVFREEQGKVVEFVPAKKGVTLIKDSLSAKIIEALDTLESQDLLSVEIIADIATSDPEISTHEVNDLGIKELLGTGVSYFKGSIPGRVHNVLHATSKLNGTLIKPGEVVSFNEILGDVSSLTGYKQAYVIKDGRTILGDGGGVCQTSTTLFRALLSAGLPIIERRAHAYRVGYYEQSSPPGIDATVYSPTTDLKFKNDTDGYLLLQAVSDLKEYKLTYEIYGASDGRVAETTTPKISSVSVPAEDIYQDDPTLPLGKIVQVEHRANGAKVSFDYVVKRGDEIIYEKTFVSNYRPWQGVYLRGTKI